MQHIIHIITHKTFEFYSQNFAYKIYNVSKIALRFNPYDKSLTKI